MTLLKAGLILLPLITMIGCGRPGNFAGGGQACIGYDNAPVPASSNNQATCQEMGGNENVSMSFNLVAQDRNKNGVLDPDDRFTGHLNFQGQKGNNLQSRVLIGGVCSDEECLDLRPLSESLASSLPNLPVNAASTFARMAQSNRVQNFRRTHPTGGVAWFFGAYRESGNNAAKCFSEDSPEDCKAMLTIAADGVDVGPGVGDAFEVMFEDLGGFYGVVTKGNLSLTSEIVPQ